jgi:Fe-S-cluster containining protein
MKMQLPELCKKCGGKCCLTHPYVTKKEFDYLVSELGTDLVDQADPEDKHNGWIQFKGRCPAYSEQGCLIPDVTHRPVTCRIYPFHASGRGNNVFDLYLDVTICPYWQVWGQFYDEVVEVFKTGMDESIEYLKHLQESGPE